MSAAEPNDQPAWEDSRSVRNPPYSIEKLEDHPSIGVLWYLWLKILM